MIPSPDFPPKATFSPFRKEDGGVFNETEIPIWAKSALRAKIR